MWKSFQEKSIIRRHYLLSNVLISLFMYIHHYWSHTKAKNIPSTVKLRSVFYEYALNCNRVLDIGCACGEVCSQLASAGFDVIGVDVNQEALKHAFLSSKEQLYVKSPYYLKADAEDLPFANQTFDIAIMQAFLTTIPTKDSRTKIMREAWRVLKQGGYLYLADFGQTWHSKIYRERYINDLSITKEEGSIIAYDQETGETAYIAHHFTEKELVFLLVENGFEIEFFSSEEFRTRTANMVNGYIFVGKKVGKFINV
ncbi:MAG: class I SAM-dependent methyltransferase [Methanomethylovorans sp.]|jgi:ubiquinone/menaquinone biosynthesis C-methylase UbiE|nr:class I SAM-dependent methyltransferase [Methanomethylovorans sp.]